MKKMIYSLDCPYYDTTFNTLQELLDDIVKTGQDPSYNILCNGRNTHEQAADLIVG